MHKKRSALEGRREGILALACLTVFPTADLSYSGFKIDPDRPISLGCREQMPQVDLPALVYGFPPKQLGLLLTALLSLGRSSVLWWEALCDSQERQAVYIELWC